MKDVIALLVILSPQESDSTSDQSEGGIRSRASTRSYTQGWDRIFGSSPSSKTDNLKSLN
jgi:hypothetical protein